MTTDMTMMKMVTMILMIMKMMNVIEMVILVINASDEGNHIIDYEDDIMLVTMIMMFVIVI